MAAEQQQQQQQQVDGKAGGGLQNSTASFVAGGCSGIVGTVALQPLDVIKTHMQASDASRQPRFWNVARTIVVRDGARGLWKGTAPSCLRVGLGAGIYFTLLGPLLSVMSAKASSGDSTEHLRDKLPVYVSLGSGALARSFAASALCPVTVVKTRMEYAAVSGLHYSGTFNAITSIARSEGIKGLYSGLAPTILRDAPYSGLYLVMYNRIKYHLTDSDIFAGGSQVFVNFISGGLAGGAATLLTHPPDVIRTRLQLQSKNPIGFFSTLRHVLQRHGISGLFTGVLPRAGRRALHQAISWTIFEELFMILTKRQS